MKPASGKLFHNAVKLGHQPETAVAAVAKDFCGQVGFQHTMSCSQLQCAMLDMFFFLLAPSWHHIVPAVPWTDLLKAANAWREHEHPSSIAARDSKMATCPTTLRHQEIVLIGSIFNFWHVPHHLQAAEGSSVPARTRV